MGAMRSANVHIFACCAVLLVAGCGTACRCCLSGNAAVASAPERVQIDGREFTLTASAWRDFQPIAPPDGQPLVVVLRASAADQASVPSELSFDHVWVLNGKERWSATPEQSSARGVTTTTSLESAVRGGPKWGPGIKVDVVARLKQGKNTWLVRAAGVEIKRTD